MAETVNTNQFKNGMHIELDGAYWRIVEFQHVKPGKGGAFVRTKLKGLENLSPDVMAHMAPFDPGAKYAVPYMQGTIGIGYNVAAVAKRLPGVRVDSWAVVFDPKNAARLPDSCAKASARRTSAAEAVCASMPAAASSAAMRPNTRAAASPLAYPPVAMPPASAPAA